MTQELSKSVIAAHHARVKTKLPEAAAIGVLGFEAGKGLLSLSGDVWGALFEHHAFSVQAPDTTALLAIGTSLLALGVSKSTELHFHNQAFKLAQNDSSSIAQNVVAAHKNRVRERWLLGIGLPIAAFTFAPGGAPGLVVAAAVLGGWAFLRSAEAWQNKSAVRLARRELGQKRA